MSDLDRAFIKAFGAPPPTVAACDRRVSRVASAADGGTSPAARLAAVEDEELVEVEAVELEVPATLPLSRFVAQPCARDAFRALLEIDRARWSPACRALCEQAARDWDAFLEPVIQGMADGRKCVALCSAARGEGRTTVALALARQVAARGLRPVVVDADFENPRLVASCGVSVRTGWDDLLSSELAVGEALIASIEDGVTLMPWRGARRPAGELAGSRAGSIFAALREHYDLVLVDTLPLADPDQVAGFAPLGETLRIDAVYLIHDVRGGSDAEVAAACARLRQGGLPLAGRIENFVSSARWRRAAPAVSLRGVRVEAAHH